MANKIVRTREELLTIVEGARQQFAKMLADAGFPADVTLDLHQAECNTLPFVQAARNLEWNENEAGDLGWMQLYTVFDQVSGNIHIYFDKDHEPTTG